jgi:carbon-monoxide dehydrogenase iron sulfur subunit
MKRVIAINQEKCTGCRLCELACSSSKEGQFFPSHSRIRVIHDGLEGWSRPSVCLQCDEPMCMAVCPVQAISISTTHGGDHVVLVAHDKCIGCQRCIVACPFGAMAFHKQSRATKCDLCGGDPQCVRFCFYGCLSFFELSEEAYGRRTKRINGLYAKACKKISADEPHKRRFLFSSEAAKVAQAEVNDS